jgi:flagellar M-ring protein FliF
VTEQTEERVDPEGNTLRSEQTTTSESRDAPAGGIPGALANTPPANATLTEAPPAAGTLAAAQTRTAGIVRNFEVSRTVTTTRPETGGIRRISAAIAVRGSAAAADGAADGAAGAAITADMLKNLQLLAETAIGFDAERGDSVTVIAQPFAAGMAAEEMPTDLSWVPGTVREVGLLIVLLVVGLGVLRPLLLRQLRPADTKLALRRGGTVEVAEGETLDDVEARLDKRHKDLAASVVGARAGRAEKQAVLRQLAADDPARVAAVLQRMLKSDAPTPL